MAFIQFLHKYIYMTVPFISWWAAQILKFFIDLISKKKVDFTRLVGSGGMPSSHTAFVISTSTAIYLLEGISNLFVLSLVLDFIVEFVEENLLV